MGHQSSANENPHAWRNIIGFFSAVMSTTKQNDVDKVKKQNNKNLWNTKAGEKMKWLHTPAPAPIDSTVFTGANTTAALQVGGRALVFYEG